MLTIAKIQNGIVIDHIKAGQGIKIFNWLGLDKTATTAAFLVNASSNRMGRKDIIKIYDTISLNCDLLGLIDPDVTVNIIEHEQVTKKIVLHLPERVEGVIHCKNPRCVTSTERAVPQVFLLEDPDLRTYRCEYCDEIRLAGEFV